MRWGAKRRLADVCHLTRTRFWNAKMRARRASATPSPLFAYSRVSAYNIRLSSHVPIHPTCCLSLSLHRPCILPSPPSRHGQHPVVVAVCSSRRVPARRRPSVIAPRACTCTCARGHSQAEAPAAHHPQALHPLLHSPKHKVVTLQPVELRPPIAGHHARRPQSQPCPAPHHPP